MITSVLIGAAAAAGVGAFHAKHLWSVIVFACACGAFAVLAIRSLPL